MSDDELKDLRRQWRTQATAIYEKYRGRRVELHNVAVSNGADYSTSSLNVVIDGETIATVDTAKNPGLADLLYDVIPFLVAVSVAKIELQRDAKRLNDGAKGAAASRRSKVSKEELQARGNNLWTVNKSMTVTDVAKRLADADDIGLSWERIRKLIDKPARS